MRLENNVGVDGYRILNGSAPITTADTILNLIAAAQKIEIALGKVKCFSLLIKASGSYGLRVCDLNDVTQVFDIAAGASQELPWVDALSAKIVSADVANAAPFQGILILRTGAP